MASDVEKNPRGTRVLKTRVLPPILLTQHSSLCRFEDQIVQSPTQRLIVQSKLQHSSFFPCSSFLFRFFLPLFFVKSFFLFFFRSAFNRPIRALAFFVLPLFIVPLQIYSSFVLHQIVLLVLLQVCCSSSTKIESQRLAFAFLSSLILEF